MDTFEVLHCQFCTGALICHAGLSAMLEASWNSIRPEVAEAKTFFAPSPAKPDPTLQCPLCRRTMEKYGYLGLAAIMIDRCDACNRVWLDADELQNMLLALAKMNYRSAARAASFDSSLLAAGLAAKMPEEEDPMSGMGQSVAVLLLRLLLRR